MNLTGVVIYDRRGGTQDRLEAKFASEKIPFLSYALPDFSWRRRVLASIDIARNYPDRVLLFLDAWDTLFLGTREDLEALPLDEGITFAAQKTCWPDPEREEAYPKWESPWRFINSNPMAGRGDQIAAALSWGWERFPMLRDDTLCEPEYDVDERFLTNLYLSEARCNFDIKLDTKCELNQIFLASVPGDLYMENGRILNLIHGTWPVFFHANGRSDIPEGL